MALTTSVWGGRGVEGPATAWGAGEGAPPYRFVHDDDGGRAQPALRLHQGVKVHQHGLTHRLGEQRRGGAPGDDGQQVVPAPPDTTWHREGNRMG